MPRLPEPLPPDLPIPFAVRDARARGVPRGRLRARDLDAPFWGVRAHSLARPDVDGLADSAAIALRHRMEAYATRMPPAHCFTGLAALVAWVGILPVPAVDLDVGVMKPGRPPRGAGVRGHQLSPHLTHVVEREGMRLTSPASTWAQLATTLDIRDLVAVGSMLTASPRGAGGVVTGPPLATIEALRRAVKAGPRHGVARLREALPIIQPGARSRAEGHLFFEIVTAGLPEPSLDVELRDARGSLFGIGDLAYVPQRVLIEYQGEYHRLSKAQWSKDIRKLERAREEGWTVVQIIGADLYPHARVAVERIRRALDLVALKT